ncbi:uncharacterized protein At2g39795, mitochondrial [Diospyros lotus]|uniref:uncharacterized protein At2g39795, mitochondrial n=1 Tax=Diospyros lotus TaxID=55363 RepID=UPI00225477F7|nr:uncharacterized protein At2g39795, mitochondrial [Diospyros lotus]
MAQAIRAARRSILFPSRALMDRLQQQQFSGQPNGFIPNFLAQNRTRMSTQTAQKSPFESILLRVLRNEIQYHSEYAPPHQLATRFKEFEVEDQPGEQWITLKGKFGENETIKIEATMFDGSVMVPKSGDDSTTEDMHLHISVLVDISKEEGCDLEFVCSAWPDHIEIQKVYIFRREGSLAQPYMGPNFGDLDNKLQNALSEFLKARGVNDDFSIFLHQFMMNKDRAELIQWFKNVELFVDK